MSRPKIVAGNWKMNKNLAEAEQLVKSVLAGINEFDEVKKIFFPSFPYLHTLSQLTQGKANVHVGAQNCSEHAFGAFTGEVAAAMLASVGCSHVLIGHSERRQYFGEGSVVLKAKLEQALQHGLSPVYCVGELLAERKENRHFQVVQTQLEEVLKALDPGQLSRVILAYEPVWAIGTGETASPAQAQEMHAHIRSCIAQLFDNAAAEAMPILYGGSCNPQNAGDLFSCPDVDGGLIGGASLKADDFCKIIYSF